MTRSVWKNNAWHFKFSDLVVIMAILVNTAIMIRAYTITEARALANSRMIEKLEKRLDRFEWRLNGGNGVNRYE